MYASWRFAVVILRVLGSILAQNPIDAKSKPLEKIEANDRAEIRTKETGTINSYSTDESIYSDPNACANSAACFMIIGDMVKLANKSPDDYYDTARRKTSKHKSQTLLINKGCLSELRRCEALAISIAKKLSIQPIDLLERCNINSWPLGLFLCENYKSWPKDLLQSIPHQYQTCKIGCEIESWEEFHIKNGKTRNFPKQFAELKKDMNLLPQKLERRNINQPTDRLDFSNYLDFGSWDYGRIFEHPVLICPKGTWIDHFYKTSINNIDNFWPLCIGDRHQDDRIIPLRTDLGEKGTEKLPVSCYAGVYDKKLRRFAITLGFTTRKQTDTQVERMTNFYLKCGGYDDNWDEDVGPATLKWPAQTCPIGSAFCSIQLATIVFDGIHRIVHIRMGCCFVPPEYAYAATLMTPLRDWSLPGIPTHGLYKKDNIFYPYICKSGDYVELVDYQIISSSVLQRQVIKLSPKCKSVKGSASYYLDMYSNTLGGSFTGEISRGTIKCLSGFFVGISAVQRPTSNPKAPGNFNSGDCDQNRLVLTYQGDENYPTLSRTCPPHQIICGFLANPSKSASDPFITYKPNSIPREGIHIHPVCCATKLPLCKPQFKLYRYVVPCDAQATVTNCEIETIIGLSNSSGTKPENPLAHPVTLEFILNKLKVSNSNDYAKALEYEWDEEPSRTNMMSIKRELGQKLYLFQPLLTCGPVTIRSSKMIHFLTPSTNCVTKDEFIFAAFDKSNVVTIYGIGLKWLTFPTDNPAVHRVNWEELAKGIRENFEKNPALTPSNVTDFDWREKNFWYKYDKNAEHTEKFDIIAKGSTSFYRVIGKCGEEWKVYTDKIVMKSFPRD